MIRALSSAGSEHLPYKQRVGGSNPSAPTFLSLFPFKKWGRLAQLVQSVCLTSRGSAVRIRQRPPPHFILSLFKKGRLAQLVQSICLTSRGSAVRIRQRPHFTFSLYSPLKRRALSSAGSERLPYKQRVGGSNPSAPTSESKDCPPRQSFFIG